MKPYEGMRIAYIRTSTLDQNEARQIKLIEEKVSGGVHKFFLDKCSAKDTKRPELQRMLDQVREGDSVYVESFSRLARSTRDLLNLVEYFDEKKVTLISLKESLDTSTPTGMLMITVIGAINAFEREQLLQRQKEGIAIAKESGKYKGRKPVQYDKQLFEELYQKWMNRQIKQKDMYEQLGMSRSTLAREIKKYTIDNA